MAGIGCISVLSQGREAAVNTQFPQRPIAGARPLR
jgi:hypothetical protein